MKNKKNLIIIIVLATIFIVMAVNFHKIKFTVSILRLYNQERSIITPLDDQGNTEIPMDDPLKEILSSSNKISHDESIKDDNNSDPSDNINDYNINISRPETNKNKVENVKSLDSLTDKEPLKNKTPKPYIDIVVEFNKTLESLQSTFEGELKALVDQGIKEYSRGELSNNKLASKYISIGSELEKVCDSKFNKVIKEMERELKSNNHPSSISKDIKKYYNSFKDAKKADLINHGKKYLD